MAKKQTYHHGDLRQALLTAALAILKTKDAKSLSLREVARQAGVSHTAPYRHFADKAALLAAVAEEGFLEFGNYLQTAVDTTAGDPVKSLQAAGGAYVRYALEHPTHFRVMFSYIFAGELAARPANEEASEGASEGASEEACDRDDTTLDSVARGTFQILVNIIESGQAAGRMKAGDPEFLAMGCWSVTHGLSMLLLDDMLSKKGEAALKMAEAVIESNMTGLVK